MNKLTLMVAAYGIESFIVECLDSIRAQTNQDFSLFLIDDGSIDKTGALADEFALEYPKLKVVHQKNAGISNVRNHMIELCESEYIWMIDGDDVIPPNAVEMLMPCLDGTREAVYFSYSRYGEADQRQLSGKITDLTPEKLKALRYKCMLSDPDPLIQRINANSSVMSAVKVETLRENNVRFEPGRKVGGDVLFTGNFLRVAKNVAYLDASLYVYRVNEGSVSLKYHKGLTALNNDLIAIFFDYVDEYFPNDEHMRELLMGRCLGTACASIQLEICHPHNPDAYSKRRKQYKEMLRVPQIAQSVDKCLNSLIGRNLKVYRVFMLKGMFFPVNLFAHIIMNKRYIVFRSRGGRVKR